MNEKQEPHSNHTLDEDIPELKQFLQPGAKVLDVGCGPGTITLGVASVVDPGEVVGVDPAKDRVDAALELSTQVAYPINVTFRIGDSHLQWLRCSFPDLRFLHCRRVPASTTSAGQARSMRALSPLSCVELRYFQGMS